MQTRESNNSNKRNFIHQFAKKFHRTMTYNEYNNYARKLLQDSNITQANSYAQKALKKSPNSPEVHLTLALILFSENKVDETTIFANNAVKYSPSYAEAHHLLAQCYLTKKEFETALAAVNNAIHHASTYTEAYFTRGNIFYRSNQLPEALTNYEKAISLKENYVEAIIQLALVNEDLEQFDKAETLFRKAIQCSPQFSVPYNYLGFLLRKLGRTAEAAESFKIAHELSNPQLSLKQLDSNNKRNLHIFKRYFRALLDFSWWTIIGKAHQNAWNNYRLLNQLTNARVGEHFNSLLRLVPGKKKSLPPWRKSSIFPWVNENDLPKILESLDREGLYVFDQLIAPEIIDSIINFTNSAEATLNPKPANGKTRALFDPNNPLTNGYQFNESEMLQEDVFQKFLGDPLVLAISQAYMGLEPKHRGLLLWWSAVFSRNPSCEMAQLFHVDLAHMKWLKFFVYLTDVTPGTGPHSFVRGSHKSNDEGKELRGRGLVRISDEDIYNCFGKDRVVDLIGPKGTVFIADTRGFHKGHLPKTDHRLVLQMYLVNSLFPDNRHHKCQLIPKNDVLKETIKKHPNMFEAYDIKHSENKDH